MFHAYLPAVRCRAHPERVTRSWLAWVPLAGTTGQQRPRAEEPGRPPSQRIPKGRRPQAGHSSFQWQAPWNKIADRRACRQSPPLGAGTSHRGWQCGSNLRPPRLARAEPLGKNDRAGTARVTCLGRARKGGGTRIIQLIRVPLRQPQRGGGKPFTIARRAAIDSCLESSAAWRQTPSGLPLPRESRPDDRSATLLWRCCIRTLQVTITPESLIAVTRCAAEYPGGNPDCICKGKGPFRWLLV